MSNYQVSGEDEVCGELGFIVKWNANEHVFNFTIGRIHGRLVEDNSIDELEQVIEGSIKWDGCANIAYDNYMHYCHPDELIEQHEVLLWCYKKAKETILSNIIDEVSV